MGKRYGRNQKREARKQIESLQCESKKLNEKVSDLLHYGKANEQAVRDTIDVLGRYFCTLPEPGDIAVRQAMDMINVCNCPAPLISWADKEVPPPLVLSEVLSLPVMRTGVHADELRRKVFVRVFIDGQGFAEMAISDRAIKIMPVDMLSKKIAKELADSIAEQLKALR